jgi:hypothetical protein
MQSHASSLATGIVTAQALVPAPGAGLRITVLGFTISVGATASKVQLIDSLTAVNTKSWSLAANGHAESGMSRWELTDNAALNLTTSANGPTDVQVDYLIEATGGTGN